MKLIKGEFAEKLDLLFAPSIRAGFPSPAEDYLSDSPDFNRDLIKVNYLEAAKLFVDNNYMEEAVNYISRVLSLDSTNVEAKELLELCQ